MQINVKLRSQKQVYEDFIIEADDEDHAIYLLNGGKVAGCPINSFTVEDRPYNISVKRAGTP